MSPRLYTLDDRSVVGDLKIDAEHREIARLSNYVIRLLDSSAGFAAAKNAFDTLAEVILEHLKTEEAFLAARRDMPGIADHSLRHEANHRKIRAAVIFTLDAFVENKATGKIPDIAALLPDIYFEQLKDMDAEMAALLKQPVGA